MMKSSMIRRVRVACIAVMFFFSTQHGSLESIEIAEKGPVKMIENRSGQDLPVYKCNKILTPLKLTGKLDDPQWQKANTVQLTDAVTGTAGRFATEVRALYDDNFLYVGFKSEDNYVWGSATERNGPIWNEECVEIFINPSGAAHQYYEINLSPNNVIFDACVLNKRTAAKPKETFVPLTDFNLQTMKTAVHINGKMNQPGRANSWTAEYAIPFDELIGAPNIPPQPRDVWRVNFYRIDSPQKGQRESYAWSTTGSTAFHLPWKFGYLEFQ